MTIRRLVILAHSLQLFLLSISQTFCRKPVYWTVFRATSAVCRLLLARITIMKKRIHILALSLVLELPLAACGGKSSNTTSITPKLFATSLLSTRTVL
jgi:hypothetical protein